MGCDRYCRICFEHHPFNRLNFMKNILTLIFDTVLNTSFLDAQTGSSPPFSLPSVLQSDEAKSALDVEKIFVGAPIIYSLLLIMSIGALAIWIFTLITWRRQITMPEQLLSNLEQSLQQRDFDRAFDQCQKSQSAIAQIILSGLILRSSGSKAVFKGIETEGKRLGLRLWQKISLLNDIAVTAPMLGLLGTVLGIFYGFYDKQRAYENLLTVFDGLGIAIGTTVIGLMVAILAMVLHATLKIWAVGLLSEMETRSLKLATSLAIGEHIVSSNEPLRGTDELSSRR